MKKILIRVVVLFFLTALGQADSSTATPIIYISEDSYIANPLFSAAPGKQQYFTNVRQNKSSVLALEGSSADYFVSAAGSLSKTFYKYLSDTRPVAISGKAAIVSLVIAGLFPGQPSDEVYIASEIALLRSYVAGAGTAYFPEDYNNSVFTDQDIKMGQDESLRQKLPVGNQVLTIEAALEAEPAAAQEPEVAAAKFEPFQKSAKPDGEVLSAQTSPGEQTTPVPETAAAPETPAVEKSAKLPEPDMATPKPPDFAAVEPFVESWAEAWEQKNVEKYLSHYSDDFITPGGMSLASWKKQRYQRLGKSQSIKIKIRDMQKQKVNTSRSRVTFIQDYQSENYSDQVVKTLELAWENGAWNIVVEMSRVLEKR